MNRSGSPVLLIHYEKDEQRITCQRRLVVSNVRPHNKIKRSHFCCELSGATRGRALYYRMRELSGRTSSYQIMIDCRNIDRSKAQTECLSKYLILMSNQVNDSITSVRGVDMS